MNLLAFTDVHGNEKALNAVCSLGRKADFCVCSGDISMFEQRLDYLVRRINGIKKPVFIIPGNHEGQMTLRRVCERYSNVDDVHGKVVAFGEYLIIGFGTSGFSLIDESFERFVDGKLRNIDRSRKIIFLSHAPPYNTRLDRISGNHVGNKSVARFIKRFHPDIVICGHLHENFGRIDRVGDTLIINPGMRGMIVGV